MTYVKTSINAPTVIGAGNGGGKESMIAFFDWDDILTQASRDDAGILLVGSHQFKENKYAIKIYATPDSIANKINSEGDIDSEGIIQEVAFNHPGSSQDIREFRANWINKNIGIIVFHCDGSDADQYGSKCAPLRLTFEHTDDKDKNSASFTFKSALKGPDVGIYQGTLTFESAADTIDADATVIDLSAGYGEYQLTDGSAEAVDITSCSNASHNLIFTLVGSGGSYPSVISSGNDFILKNGVSWTALSNSSISFKAFADGASSYKFIEISRS